MLKRGLCLVKLLPYRLTSCIHHANFAAVCSVILFETTYRVDGCTCHLHVMKFVCGACVAGFSPTSSLGYTGVTPSVFPPLTANLGMQNGFGNSSLGQLNSNAPGPIGKSSQSFPPISAVSVRSVLMLPAPSVSPASRFHRPLQSGQWNSDALGPISKFGQSFPPASPVKSVEF